MAGVDSLPVAQPTVSLSVPAESECWPRWERITSWPQHFIIHHQTVARKCITYFMPACNRGSALFL